MKFFIFFNDNNVIMINLKKISLKRNKRSYSDENDSQYLINNCTKNSGLKKSESLKKELNDLENLIHRMKHVRIDLNENLPEFPTDNSLTF